MEKVRISQDTLYQFLLEHGIKLVRLAELMGMSCSSLTSCFKHQLIKRGTPRSFTPKAIVKLNEALPQIAENLRSSFLVFGSEQVFTNQRGKTYDPALIEPMKKIGGYMNLTALVQRVLGWNQDKKENTLVTPSSKNYGCISKQDADRINAELLSVAGMLSSYEVVADEGSSSESSQKIQPTETQSKKNKNSHLGEYRKDPFVTAINDTSLPITERYRIFHEKYPEGILFFRVNGGYTVAQDDASRLAELDSSVYPFTDPASGLTTAYMSAAKWESVLPICFQKDWIIMITYMRSEEWNCIPSLTEGNASHNPQ